MPAAANATCCTETPILRAVGMEQPFPQPEKPGLLPDLKPRPPTHCQEPPALRNVLWEGPGRAFPWGIFHGLREQDGPGWPHLWG